MEKLKFQKWSLYIIKNLTFVISFVVLQLYRYILDLYDNYIYIERDLKLYILQIILIIIFEFMYNIYER